MSSSNVSISTGQWIVAGLFAVLCVGVLAFFVRVAEPEERKPVAAFVQTYDAAPLAAALAAPRLNAALAEIQAAGAPRGRAEGRLSGSPGCAATEALVRKHFAAAGLEVHAQTFDTVVPVTDYCEVLDARGTPLPGVTLYPFQPAGLMPTVLPEEGVRGTLLYTESTNPLDLVGKRLNGTILLNNGFNCKWTIPASMGVKAVIVKENPTEKPGDPNQPLSWDNLLTPFDAAYPRFLARGPLEKYAGQPLRLRSKTRWQTVPARNLIGVLHATKPTEEALILTAHYDAYSVVPELAPGAESAVSLAAMLNLVDALKPYAASMKRDVIFIATAGHGETLTGVSRLMEAMPPYAKISGVPALDTELAGHRQRAAFAAKGLELIVNDRVWHGDGIDFGPHWQKFDPAFRAWFEKAYVTVAGEINLEQRERFLQARLAWIRGGRPTFREGFDANTASQEARSRAENRHPLMATYLDAKAADTQAGNALSTPFYQVAANLAEGNAFDAWGYRAKMRAYLTRTRDYEARQVRACEDIAALRPLFAGYARTLTVNLALNSGGAGAMKDLSVLAGIQIPGSAVEPQGTDLRNAIAAEVPLKGEEPTFRVSSWGTRDAAGGPNDPNIHSPGNTEMESAVWFRNNMLAFTVINKGFFPPKAGTPEDTFASITGDTAAEQLLPVGRALLAMAHGKIEFKTMKPTYGNFTPATVRGGVYANAGTTSMVPNHPMGDRTFVQIYRVTGQSLPSGTRGVRQWPIIETDPYGNYCRRMLYDSLGSWGKLAVDAARFGADGRMTYYKDASPASQTIFKNEELNPQEYVMGREKAVNVALFRCTPVECYQKGNPKTLNAFARFDFLNSIGLQQPERYHFESSPNAPAVAAYLEPDCTFYVAMLDGSAANPEVQTYRAFMLNVDPRDSLRVDATDIPTSEEDLSGRGYLAADTANLTFPYFDAAASMLRTNAKRLRLQKQYHMDDAQMQESHAKAIDLLQQARKFHAQGDDVSAVNAAGRALSNAVNNHPVIRTKISNAIFGILWYLGLLVPFVFFVEKLLFGFTDIRKQLVAVGGIFVVIFALLRIFHPAFQMVNQPLMILLGFLILLLTLLVSALVTAKFQSTIRVLRRNEGYVEGADINRGGVVGTAFMLGLNNMRRRQVRTGLTCVTLIMITFMMICFTSVSTDVVETEYPTGRSHCNGLLRRDPNFVPLSDAEVNNINQIYGLRYPVAVYTWTLTNLQRQQPQNPTIEVKFTKTYGKVTDVKGVRLNSSVTMPWNEPAFSGIDKFLLTKRGWFPRPPETKDEMAAAAARGETQISYVMLPDSAARDLGISVNDVNAGHPVVDIRGEPYEVLGIFDTTALNAYTGMDGQSILPFDLNSVKSVSRNAKGAFTLPPNIERMKASQVMLVNKPPKVDGQTDYNAPMACAVLFPSSPYRLRADLPEFPGVAHREQEGLKREYLERIGEQAYYAVDGIAYYGQRTRQNINIVTGLGQWFVSIFGDKGEKSANQDVFAGLLQMLIPILIAAMTVFNTMRGSVYERKDEIYVYNAVGIAPNHIFFMFMAEACVYAVIGAMAGYLLSQITGTVLTAMHLTGGLNMDYSSIETIYASLAIVGAVLLSTILPARTAATLALPSDEVSWSVPKADGDTMTFNLPFTFNAHDRVAVVSYFYRWLDANGEGSSGAFYCATPQPTVREEKGEVTPGIETTIWLKPFDLGVSQRLRIALPTDPETGEFIAQITITRLSGTMAAWERAVMPFLTALRKQFLNWRAVTDAERTEMFDEAKTLLTTHQEREAVHV
jgi:hypothetical protein